jgi:hypothetical protein
MDDAERRERAVEELTALLNKRSHEYEGGACVRVLLLAVAGGDRDRIIQLLRRL